MLPYERRQAVLSVIATNGSATVKELAERFDVSVVTIRRDLQQLEVDGFVAKTHGGAVDLRRDTYAGSRLTEREQQYREEKQRIGRRAAELIGPGQTVILDEGSTCLEIAHNLRQAANITVITNGMRVAMELLGTNVNLILIGGMCNHENAMLYGPDTERTYSSLRADIYFMGIDAFAPSDGIMDANFLQVNLKQAKVQAAMRVIGVAHGAKFGRRAISRVCPLTILDALVTDTPVAADLCHLLSQSGIDLIEAP